MTSILNVVLTKLRNINDNFNRDARISHLPLLGPPWPMICILTIYILFVRRWGPRLMKGRRPYNVTNLMQAYNLLQIVINAYVFIGAIKYTYMQPHYKLSCAEYNPKDTRPSYMNLRYPAYAYYLSKYLDLLDTVFFVLRKNYRQITFLHVYHHTIMVYGVWAYATLIFGSHFTMVGILNSFIHVCMYSYYFMAALKLKTVDLLPWKKRLTQLQILQFIAVLFHFLQVVVNNWCQLDMFWVWLSITNNFIMLLLFINFYIKAYTKNAKGKKV